MNKDWWGLLDTCNKEDVEEDLWVQRGGWGERQDVLYLRSLKEQDERGERAEEEPGEEGKDTYSVCPPASQPLPMQWNFQISTDSLPSLLSIRSQLSQISSVARSSKSISPQAIITITQSRVIKYSYAIHTVAAELWGTRTPICKQTQSHNYSWFQKINKAESTGKKEVKQHWLEITQHDNTAWERKTLLPHTKSLVALS